MNQNTSNLNAILQSIEDLNASAGKKPRATKPDTSAKKRRRFRKDAAPLELTQPALSFEPDVSDANAAMFAPPAEGHTVTSVLDVETVETQPVVEVAEIPVGSAQEEPRPVTQETRAESTHDVLGHFASVLDEMKAQVAAETAQSHAAQAALKADYERMERHVQEEENARHEAEQRAEQYRREALAASEELRAREALLEDRDRELNERIAEMSKVLEASQSSEAERQTATLALENAQAQALVIRQDRDELAAQMEAMKAEYEQRAESEAQRVAQALEEMETLRNESQRRIEEATKNADQANGRVHAINAQLMALSAEHEQRVELMKQDHEERIAALQAHAEESEANAATIDELRAQLDAAQAEKIAMASALAAVEAHVEASKERTEQVDTTIEQLQAQTRRYETALQNAREREAMLTRELREQQKAFDEQLAHARSEAEQYRSEAEEIARSSAETVDEMRAYLAELEASARTADEGAKERIDSERRRIVQALQLKAYEAEQDQRRMRNLEERNAELAANLRRMRDAASEVVDAEIIEEEPPVVRSEPLQLTAVNVQEIPSSSTPTTRYTTALAPRTTTDVEPTSTPRISVEDNSIIFGSRKNGAAPWVVPVPRLRHVKPWMLLVGAATIALIFVGMGVGIARLVTPQVPEPTADATATEQPLSGVNLMDHAREVIASARTTALQADPTTHKAMIDAVQQAADALAFDAATLSEADLLQRSVELQNAVTELDAETRVVLAVGEEKDQQEAQAKADKKKQDAAEKEAAEKKAQATAAASSPAATATPRVTTPTPAATAKKTEEPKAKKTAEPKAKKTEEPKAKKTEKPAESTASTQLPGMSYSQTVTCKSDASLSFTASGSDGVTLKVSGAGTKKGSTSASLTTSVTAGTKVTATATSAVGKATLTWSARGTCN